MGGLLHPLDMISIRGQGAECLLPVPVPDGALLEELHAWQTPCPPRRRRGDDRMCVAAHTAGAPDWTRRLPGPRQGKQKKTALSKFLRKAWTKRELQPAGRQGGSGADQGVPAAARPQGAPMRGRGGGAGHSVCLSF